MSKKVALVGHCGPDSSYLRIAVSRVGKDVQVLSVDDGQSLQQLLDGGVDLLLLNRQLDFGFEDGEGVPGSPGSDQRRRERVIAGDVIGSVGASLFEAVECQR